MSEGLMQGRATKLFAIGGVVAVIAVIAIVIGVVLSTNSSAGDENYAQTAAAQIETTQTPNGKQNTEKQTPMPDGYTESSTAKTVEVTESGNMEGSPSFQNLMDPQNFVQIPGPVTDRIDSVVVTAGFEGITFAGQNIDVFNRQVTPEVSVEVPITVLLLHGAAFTSKNWEDIDTLQLLGAMGHRAVAIDVPGFGQTGSSSSIRSSADRAAFLAAFVKHENLDRPIVVSPSMSGGWSLPFIMGTEPSTCTDRVRGYIPVAPVSTGSYTAAQYSQCQAPTFIVYGSRDTGLGLSSLSNLKNLPNNAVAVMENAGHPSYLDKPEEWRYLLYNYMRALEKYYA